MTCANRDTPAASVLTTIVEVERLQPAWDVLMATSTDASPFLSHAWVLCWWEHFGRDDQLRVAIASEGGQITGIAPFLGWRRGIGPASLSGMVGLGQETADYGGMLLGETPAHSAPALLNALRLSTGRRPSIVNLTRLRPGGDTLASVLCWLESEDGARAGWALSKSFEEEYPYRSLGPAADESVGRSLKRNDVRRRLRRLSERHEVTFDSHVQGESAGRLREFLDLHALRWAAKGGSPTGLFSTSAGQAFLRDVSAELDRAGWLRISFVRVDGKPIAGRYGTLVNGTYAGMKSGWDPAFSEFGPGHLIVGMLLEDLEQSGASEFDFMRGAGAHKQAWTRESRTVGYWQLQPKGWSGVAARQAARFVTRQRYRSRFS